MNIVSIDKQFKKLELIEDYINFRFEPKSEAVKDLKRHIFYEDLKNDFVNEVNTFGFSPYIQQASDVQRKNKVIMGYKENLMNDGFLNYVRKGNQRTHNSNIVDYKLNQEDIKAKLKDRMQGGIHKNKFCKIKKIELITDEKEADKIRNDNFLQKALENLAKTKINMSEDSNLFLNDKARKDSSNDKENLSEYEKFKIDFINNLQFKVHLNPFISYSDYRQPNPMVMKFEKFFKKKSIGQGGIKKMVGLYKNKDILNTLKVSESHQQDLQKNQLGEIQRDSVNLKNALKIFSQKRESVFKRLSKFVDKSSAINMKSIKNDANILLKDIPRRSSNFNQEQYFDIIDSSPNSLFKKIEFQKKVVI
jgi:hypothetical protein